LIERFRTKQLGVKLLPLLQSALIGAALIVGRSSSIAAESDDDPVVLPPWIIAERTDPTLQAARNDRFAATLGPTSVVTSAAWEGRTVATLAEALRASPGLMGQESFGGFEPPRISIRGSGLDSAPSSRGIALLVDGLPLARADGSFQSGLFDPLIFSRLEVYRGTMHLALTPAVLGGVLHAVSANAAAVSETSLRAEADDLGAARGVLAYRGAAARLAGSWARARGWREHSAQDRRTIDAAIARSLGAATQLDFSVYAATADYEVPGPLTLLDATNRPRTVSAAVERDRPRRFSSVVRPALRLGWSDRDGSLTAGVAGQRLRDEFVQLQANGISDSTSDDMTGHATVSRRLPVGLLDHQLLARGNLSIGENRIARFLNVRSERGARFATYAGRASTAALSVEDMIWLGPTLAVGGGLTALHAERVLLDRDPGTAIARSLRFTDASPRAGTTWQAGRQVWLNLAYSSGIEPPAFEDLVAVAGGHPSLALKSRELRAQRASTWEVGGHGSIGRLAWNITAYRARWSGEILRLADATGLPRGAVNADRTRHEGVETSLRWTRERASHRWSLIATSTLGRFRFDDDPVYGDNRIAGAAPHTGSAELAYSHARGFFAGVETTWSNGRTSVDHAGRLGYGGHGLLHGRMGWRPTGRFTLFLSARNLFDRTHISSTAGVLDLARTPATTAIFLPGVGRRVSVGIEWKR
jgi:iron complex outermembrane receptor protein